MRGGARGRSTLPPSQVGLVFARLHLQDVRDHAVDLDVAYEAGEEKILESVGLEGAERGEKEEQAREPGAVGTARPGAAVPLQLHHRLVLQPLHCVLVRTEQRNCAQEGELLLVQPQPPQRLHVLIDSADALSHLETIIQALVNM